MEEAAHQAKVITACKAVAWIREPGQERERILDQHDQIEEVYVRKSDYEVLIQEFTSAMQAFYTLAAELEVRGLKVTPYLGPYLLEDIRIVAERCMNAQAALDVWLRS